MIKKIKNLLIFNTISLFFLVLPTNADNHNNPFATLEILISSKSISRMFNEAGEYINVLNTFRIEDILKNKQNFLEFLKTTINFDEKLNDIPREFIKKVNSHRKENKDNKNVISKQELVLIDYFLTNSGKEVIDKLYPDNQFLKTTRTSLLQFPQQYHNHWFYRMSLPYLH